MEHLTVKYRPLLTVQFLLHQYLDSTTTRYENMPDEQRKKPLRQYNLNKLVDIQPTPACNDVLKQGNLLFRTTPTGFLVGTRTVAEVTDAGGVNVKPYRVLDASVVLDFGFRFKDGVSTQTALPIAVKQDGEPASYLFGNELAHTSGLTLPILYLPFLTYNTTVRYFRGDLIQKDGSRYICLTSQRAGILNILPGVLDHWQVIDANRPVLL